eukprot:GFUD01032444.1.p1 GENE.GFUD01032444.1~~GFUD01032444.1.p1  ORF type:complete len:435 (+),score=91.99 GFUD01032444.1:46-1350(+)
MLPSEILIIVFSNLDLDSLENARNTSKKWNNLIKTSVHLWKSLVNQHCASNKPRKEILQMQMYKEIQKSAEKLEQFYRKLVKIEENFLSNNYRVRTLNCLEAEFEGKKVVKSSEWEQNHNYKGVYDMILNKNRLVASVYDTIQVWDMSSYQVANILPSKILDEPHCATTCFTLLDDKFLICGTQNGFLKIFEIPSGKFLTQVKRNSNYISDVNASGDVLASLDWYGEITLWKFSSSNKAENVTEEGKFQVPLILAGRENERLLDFTSEFLVSTFKCHLTCYRYGEFFRSYPAPSDIFCIGIHGDKLAFGCKGNRDTPAAGILKLGWDKLPQVVYLRTRDNDPVISLSFNEKFLILGDVNGELHVVDVEKIVFPESGEVTIELGKESENGVVFVGTIRTHEYRAFIWACKTDPYRIFSGDETGKIIVHDYLMFED